MHTDTARIRATTRRLRAPRLLLAADLAELDRREVARG